MTTSPAHGEPAPESRRQVRRRRPGLVVAVLMTTVGIGAGTWVLGSTPDTARPVGEFSTLTPAMLDHVRTPTQTPPAIEVAPMPNSVLNTPLPAARKKAGDVVAAERRSRKSAIPAR